MNFEPVLPLGDLIMKHAGERICVMGGGKSLDSDLEQVEADVYISVNDHGARRRPVDYIVCMDNIHTGNKREMRHYLRQFSDAPVISPWHWGQYQMARWPGLPKMYNSGVIATWVASLMGAHPLIIAGFDCYNGDKRIMDMHREFLDRIECQVRVVSGPLQSLYPAYKPKEKLKKFVAPSLFSEAKEGLIKIRVDKHFEYRGHEWPIGTILTVPEIEVWRQIKHKSISRVE